MASTRLQTDVRLAPVRSQVVLLAFVILGGCCLAVAFWFLWKSVNTWYVPLVTGTVLLALSAAGWLRSHRDIDRQGAHPFMVRDTSTGREVSADVRALDQQTTREWISRAVTALAYQRPLPDPDGLIDSAMNPLPKTKAAATERVATANAEAERYRAQLFGALRPSESATETAQTKAAPLPSLPTAGMPPQIVESNSD